ncbi:hypothetical protein [Roseateles sp.]|uniref:hypothetical protein n=1 Tax=Roseateles sp. TaxID=1971397 RepID=UPI0025CCD3D4|nr:hypothetical protein [Roseateles sp.]MBV8036138.1 hypothetical protein [Roseateles sp.]
MSIIRKFVPTATLLLAMCTAAAVHAQEIPRAPSTPQTPKNWVGPKQKIVAQVLVDELIASRPDIMSITMHATPPGEKEVYTMIAGSFPDRIGNQSSPGDVITLKKGVSQVESKWGTPDYQKKVSTVLPLKDVKGNYLPVAMVIAFHTSPTSGKKDTDFLAPGLAIRDALSPRTPSVDALFAPAQ